MRPEITDLRHRILITDGAGFIGSAVVLPLIAETDSVVTNLDSTSAA